MPVPLLTRDELAASLGPTERYVFAGMIYVCVCVFLVEPSTQKPKNEKPPSASKAKGLPRHELHKFGVVFSPKNLSLCFLVALCFIVCFFRGWQGWGVCEVWGFIFAACLLWVLA